MTIIRSTADLPAPSAPPLLGALGVEGQRTGGLRGRGEAVRPGVQGPGSEVRPGEVVAEVDRRGLRGDRDDGEPERHGKGDARAAGVLWCPRCIGAKTASLRDA
jgi:hypothetical protein